MIHYIWLFHRVRTIHINLINGGKECTTKTLKKCQNRKGTEKKQIGKHTNVFYCAWFIRVKNDLGSCTQCITYFLT